MVQIKNSNFKFQSKNYGFNFAGIKIKAKKIDPNRKIFRIVNLLDLVNETRLFICDYFRVFGGNHTGDATFCEGISHFHQFNHINRGGYMHTHFQSQ